MDLFAVKDKVVVITGGSGFLGSQYCKVFEDLGAKVVNWDVDTGVNIAMPDAVLKAAMDVIGEHGRIDVLINNAAINFPPTSDNWKAYENFSLLIWEAELKTNLTGAFIVTQQVARVMMKQKSGSIIFVASDLALIGPDNSIYESGKFKDIAYITSKAGILGLMRAWASYMGPYNVRVNALVPGGMYHNHSDEFAKKNGALNMLGRMARESEFNGPMIFLASDASSFMTGSCLVVDGGRTAW